MSIRRAVLSRATKEQTSDAELRNVLGETSDAVGYTLLAPFL